MIKLNVLNELTKYCTVPQDALDFVLRMTADTPNGRYDFGADCYVNVMSCDTSADLAPMEAHEQYIDVQMVLSGEEKIYVAKKAPLAVVTPYDEGKDVAFYAWQSADSVTYRSGEAVILSPEEAHLPGRAVGEPMTIKKAVLKLRMV